MTKTQITYSSSYPIILTHLCSNRCGYCEFPVVKKHNLPSKKIILSKINRAAKNGATSIQLIAGEEISENPSVLQNITYYGLSSYIDYIRMTVESIISVNSTYCLLPFIDLGVFSFGEMVLFRDWIFSLRLSLESIDPQLMGMLAHRDSPTKKAEIRKSALTAAGKAKIPTTTGILIGIGEKPVYRFKAIEDVTEINAKYSHIQSFAINRFYPIPNTPMAAEKRMSDKSFISFIKEARKLLPSSIPIQIDINKEEALVPKLIEAGVTDLGELDLSAEKFANPDKYISNLQNSLGKMNIEIRERLPIYDEYVLRGWFPQRFMPMVKFFYINRLKKPEFASKITKCIIEKK